MYKKNIIPTGMARGDDAHFIVECPDLPFTTGDTVTMTVRTIEGVGDVLFSITVTTFTNGIALITVPHNTTKDLEFGVYSYDVQCEYDDSSVGIQTIIDCSPFTLGTENTYGN